jgi:hypothetical protein
LIEDQGPEVPEVMELLGMEKEEVKRPHFQGGMVEKGSTDGFTASWVPTKNPEGVDK